MYFCDMKQRRYLKLTEEEHSILSYLQPTSKRVETLWRKIKYEWLLPQDFVSWDNMTSKLEDILSNMETKYTIKFEHY